MTYIIILALVAGLLLAALAGAAGAVCQPGFAWQAGGANNPNGICTSASGAVMAPISRSVGHHVADPTIPISAESTLGQAMQALKNTGASLTP